MGNAKFANLTNKIFLLTLLARRMKSLQKESWCIQCVIIDHRNIVQKHNYILDSHNKKSNFILPL